MAAQPDAFLRFQPRNDSGRSYLVATARARQGRLTTLAILITAPAAAAFVVFTPGIVGLGAAVAAAIGWSLWLEHHRE